MTITLSWYHILSVWWFVRICWIYHDDVIKWRHFLRHWPFVKGIHRSLVDSPHKGQWRGALIFSLICVWTNGWANNGDAGNLRRHRVNYDLTVMIPFNLFHILLTALDAYGEHRRTWTSCGRFQQTLSWTGLPEVCAMVKSIPRNDKILQQNQWWVLRH